MALLGDKDGGDDVTAAAARRATYRVHHVGTKLNEGELRAFAELTARRQQTQGELIRGLVLGEIERDKQPAPELRPSVELEEITALRLLLVNILPKLATGEKMTLETYQKIEAEVKNRKSSRGLELVKEWQQRGKKP
jgi:hypothetical protein